MLFLLMKDKVRRRSRHSVKTMPPGWKPVPVALLVPGLIGEGNQVGLLAGCFSGENLLRLW